jgi:hypothetical protein
MRGRPAAAAEHVGVWRQRVSAMSLVIQCKTSKSDLTSHFLTIWLVKPAAENDGDDMFKQAEFIAE